MKFDIIQSIQVLKNTPNTLDSMLKNLSNVWLHSNEGPNTWSPYEVVGHLIHGEKTDWMLRVRLILSESENKTFIPFDRFAQINSPDKKTIKELLDDFRLLRDINIKELESYSINNENLEKNGIHPELGPANLKELLSAWLVHDLGHIAQISRVMAKQYSSEVGPWKAYLNILR